MKKIITYIYILFFLAWDLVSKYVFYNMRIWSERDVLVPLLNTGVARSIPIPQLFTILLTCAMIIVFIYIWKKWLLYTYIWITSSRMLYICNGAMTLLVAGSIGNLYDRIVYNGVRDFISINVWYLWDLWYPIFNIADIYIVIGTLVLMYVVYISDKKKIS